MAEYDVYNPPKDTGLPHPNTLKPTPKKVFKKPAAKKPVKTVSVMDENYGQGPTLESTLPHPDSIKPLPAMDFSYGGIDTTTATLPHPDEIKPAPIKKYPGAYKAFVEPVLNLGSEITKEFSPVEDIKNNPTLQKIWQGAKGLDVMGRTSDYLQEASSSPFAQEHPALKYWERGAATATGLASPTGLLGFAGEALTNPFETTKGLVEQFGTQEGWKENPIGNAVTLATLGLGVREGMLKKGAIEPNVFGRGGAELPKEAGMPPITSESGFARIGKEAKDLAVDAEGKNESWYPQAKEFILTQFNSEARPLQRRSPELYEDWMVNKHAYAEHTKYAIDAVHEAFTPTRGIKVRWGDELANATEIAEQKIKIDRAKNLIPRNIRVDDATINSIPVVEARYNELKKSNPEVAAKVDETIKNIDAVGDAELRRMVEAGILSEEQYTIVKAKNPFPYVSFKRILEKNGVNVRRFSGGGIKKIKGSELEINNTIDNTMENIVGFRAYTDKMVLKRNVIDYLHEQGLADKITQIQPEMSQRKSIGFDKDDNFGQITEVFFPKRDLPKGQHIVKRNGKTEVWEIKDPEISELFEHSPAPNIGMKFWYKLAEIKRQGVTLATAFMVRNPVRDVKARNMNDTSLIRHDTAGHYLLDSAKFLPRMPKQFLWDMPVTTLRIIANDNPAVMKAIKTVYPNFYEGIYGELTKEGARASTFVKPGQGGLKGARKSAMGLKPKFKDLIIDVPATPFRIMEYMASIAEQTTRLEYAEGVFKRTGDMKEAMRGFDEITANFSEKGKFTKKVGKVTPFFSAQFAGLRAELDAIKIDPIQYGTKFALLTAPALYLWYKNRKEEWYQDLEPYIKNTYYIVGKYGDTIVRIPRGYGLDASLGAIIERILDKIDYDAPDTVDGIMQAASTSIPSFPMPVGISTGWGLGRNTNLFTEAPINPYFSKDTPRYLVQNPSTTEVAKVASRYGNFGKPFRESGPTPPQIDYTIQDLTGTLGKDISRGASSLMTMGKGGVKPSIGIEDVPGPSVFMMKSPELRMYNGTINRFYDNVKHTVSTKKELDTLENEGRNHELNKQARRYGWQEYARIDFMNKANKKMSEYNDNYKYIKNSKNYTNLTPAKKNEWLEFWSKKATDLAREANKGWDYYKDGNRVPEDLIEDIFPLTYGEE